MVQELNGSLDLDSESIQEIDDYINRNRMSFSEEQKERLISIFGSFLGEAIIKNFGGEWAWYEEALGIHLKDESFVFPFSKVSKQINNGPEDSIYSFYNVIPMLLNGSL
jgi:hypothetical protein